MSGNFASGSRVLDEVAGGERVAAEDADDRVDVANPVHRAELVFAAAAPERSEQFVPRCLQRRYFAAGAKCPALLGRVARLQPQTAGVLRDEIAVAGVEVDVEAHDERFVIVDSRQAEGMVDVLCVVQQIADEVAANLVAHQPQAFLEDHRLAPPFDVEVVERGVLPLVHLACGPFVGIGDVEALGVQIAGDPDEVGDGIGDHAAVAGTTVPSRRLSSERSVAMSRPRRR